MGAESRLQDLGISVPAPLEPAGSYVPWVRTGNLVFVSGQVPLKDGQVRAGLVDADLSVSEALSEARTCGLNALAALRQAAGSLDNVARIVKLTVFVASSRGFIAQPQVANGASELMVEVFGDDGRHARAAVGVASLPLGAAVEVELVAEVRA